MSCKQHVPQRTCVACRRVTPQRELVRLVRTGHSRVEVDAAGRKAGRGAYLCRAVKCWEDALRTGRLEHALRTPISPESREDLTSFIGCL